MRKPTRLFSLPHLAMSVEWESASTVCGDSQTRPPAESTQLDREKLPRPASRTRVYPGSGTLQDPYVVDWDEEDTENPLKFPNFRKWIITSQVCFFSSFPLDPIDVQISSRSARGRYRSAPVNSHVQPLCMTASLIARIRCLCWRLRLYGPRLEHIR